MANRPSPVTTSRTQRLSCLMLPCLVECTFVFRIYHKCKVRHRIVIDISAVKLIIIIIIIMHLYSAEAIVATSSVELLNFS